MKVFLIILAICVAAVLIHKNHSTSNVDNSKSGMPKPKAQPSASMSTQHLHSNPCLPLYEDLSEDEKLSILAYLAFLSSFADTDYNMSECKKMLIFTAKMMGLDDMAAIRALSSVTDAKRTLNTIANIQEETIREMIIYNCHAFTQFSSNPLAQVALYRLAHDMGYSKADVATIIIRKEAELSIFTNH